jgi:hypothetical protein
MCSLISRNNYFTNGIRILHCKNDTDMLVTILWNVQTSIDVTRQETYSNMTIDDPIIVSTRQFFCVLLNAHQRSTIQHVYYAPYSFISNILKSTDSMLYFCKQIEVYGIFC